MVQNRKQISRTYFQKTEDVLKYLKVTQNRNNRSPEHFSRRQKMFGNQHEWRRTEKQTSRKYFQKTGYRIRTLQKIKQMCRTELISRHIYIIFSYLFFIRTTSRADVLCLLPQQTTESLTVRFCGMMLTVGFVSWRK